MRVAKGDLALRYVVRVRIGFFVPIPVPVLVLVPVFVLVFRRRGWRRVDHLVDIATRIVLVVDVFPALGSFGSPLLLGPPLRLLPFFLFGVRVGRREIVMVRYLEHVVLGIVRNLAVALVDHVLADGVERAEFASPAVAVYADVAHGDLLAEVGDQSRDVDEVLRVGNEKRVLARHVREIIFQGSGNARAEETVGWRKSRSCGGDLLIQSCGILILLILVGAGLRQCRLGPWRFISGCSRALRRLVCWR